MDTPIQILIVDGDTTARNAIGRALDAASLPAQWTGVSDATQAMAALYAGPIDCVLLAARVAPSGGLELLRQLRAAGLMLPVVLILATGDRWLVEQLRQIPATDYLMRGQIDPTTLALRVRRAVQLAVAQRQAEQQRVLAAVVHTLAAQPDRAPLGRLARLALPTLGDWCAIDVVSDDGAIRRLLVTAHGQPASSGEQAIWRAFPPETALALAEYDQAACYPALPDAVGPPNPALAQVCRQLGATTMLCLALRVGGRSVGALTFAVTSTPQRFRQSDLALADLLAHHAALAIELARLSHSARAAAQSRELFLSMAAHELKTPLTSLMGYAELLSRRLVPGAPFQPRDTRALRVLVEQARRLNRLVAELLDLSRIQNGSLSIERRPLNLAALVRQVVDEAHQTLRSHQLALRLSDDVLPIEGDESRLAQVVQSLVQNAIKYSPPGATIALALARRGDAAVLTVSDRGMGIPREAVPRIFACFYRAPNAIAQQISGMGVGLHVVKAVVERHGGSVRVASTEHQGSTFTVELPLRRAPIPVPLIARSVGQD